MGKTLRLSFLFAVCWLAGCATLPSSTDGTAVDRTAWSRGEYDSARAPRIERGCGCPAAVR
jgi:hypothetical protein